MDVLKGREIQLDSSVKEDNFSELFEKYYARLCRYANHFVDDIEVCKDMVQDIFIKLWKIDYLKFSSEELEKYLLRSVKNSCFSYLRKLDVRNSSRELILKGLLEQEEVDVPEIELKELAGRINEAIGKLPEQTALIFNLSRRDGMSYPEIAKELNMTEKGVQYHISNALKVLRVELKDYLPLIIWIFKDM
ncbi:RNA polymerase sigma-70 factor [Puteibacter caeruleilacunae]|nr:RNA polymerase sigma-70 factor [Puteibacter caeruleilacunae]